MKPSDDLIVSSTEPTGEDRKKVWMQKGRNLFDKENVTSQYIISNTGEVLSNGWYLITDYIEVTPNTNYLYMGLTAPGNAPYSAYYDKDKNFISSFKQATGVNIITIPDNAYYVRFSIERVNTTDKDTFLIKEGTMVIPYEPYVEDKKIYIKNENDVYEEFMKKEENLGNIQIINMETKTLATDNLASGGSISKSDTFTAIDGADGYIVMQQNNNWLIPTGITISGNTLSCVLLNPFSSAKTGNCSFVILAYKNR